MLIQAIEQHSWVHFCEVIGRPDLATRGDWTTSHIDSATGDLELRDELVKVFASKTQEEWTKIFIDNNVAGAPYYPLKEVENTELFRVREMIAQQNHPLAGRVKMNRRQQAGRLAAHGGGATASFANRGRVIEGPEPLDPEGLQRHLGLPLGDKLRNEFSRYRRQENAVAEVPGGHVDVLHVRQQADDGVAIGRAWA